MINNQFLKWFKSRLKGGLGGGGVLLSDPLHYYGGSLPQYLASIVSGTKRQTDRHTHMHTFEHARNISKGMDSFNSIPSPKMSIIFLFGLMALCWSCLKAFLLFPVSPKNNSLTKSFLLIVYFYIIYKSWEYKFVFYGECPFK